MLYSPNHNQSQQYIYICRYRQIQIHKWWRTLIHVWTVLLTSNFGSSTRGKRHNSYYANHPSYPNARCILWCLRSLSVEICKTPSTCLNGRELDSLCPNGREHIYLPAWSNVNLKLPWFFKSSNSQPISSRHDVIHTPAPFPVWRFIMTRGERHNSYSANHPQRATTSSTAQIQLSTDSFFQILKFSWPSLLGMTSSSLQLHFLSRGLLWPWWLSYPLHANVKLHIMTMLRTLNPNCSKPYQIEW